MIILGLHHGHDSSAAIIRDGVVLADVQEERFRRLKHSADFPFDALAFCLKRAGLDSIAEVDAIAWSGTSIPVKDAGILGLELPTGRPTMRSRVKSLVSGPAPAVRPAQLPVYFPDLTLSPGVELVRVEHHLAHACSAHYTRRTASPCLVFSIDGMGDGFCTTVWRAEGNSVEPLQKLGTEAAIGWAYSIVTEGLHWIHGDGEGKTMGLAPYGDAEVCRGVLDHLFPVFEGTELSRPTTPGQVDTWTFLSSHQWHMEEARQVERLAAEYGRENLAAEAQRKLEEVVLGYIEAWVRKSGIRNIAFAGGLFLNVKLNQRIWEMREGLFDEQHIFPNPGDSGLSVGAVLHLWHSRHGFDGSSFDNLYWGPGYEDAEVEKVLSNCKLPCRRSADAPAEAARMLADGAIIGWFQGAMESGPRALGNRSILMSPLKAENKDIINARVKYREGFRPFCPSMTVESRDDYLVDARDEPFMITSFDVREEMKGTIPAVVHVDGTARPQMISREANPRYWELIRSFGEITGHPVVLNTSFNVKGEPIVCTPMDAVRCFYSNGLDALFIGDLVLEK